MTQFTFSNTKISGISCVVPPKELSLLEDLSLYGGDQKKIQRVINSSGFLKRRVTEKDVMTSDLCEQAANDLISKLSIPPSEVDALLFVSYTPDYLMPATSYILHKKLGLSNSCVVMDIPQACSGFVLGLFQAAMLVNAGCRKVLLLVGDSFSKFSDMFIDKTAPVFGDAGSATLIEYDADASKMYFQIESSGSGYDSLICPNGGFRNPPTKNSFYENGDFSYGSKMDGGKIFDFTMNKIATHIQELLEYSGVQKKAIEHFVLHQANKFILQNIIRLLDVSEEKCPMQTISKYGNQCGASIPCAISNELREKVSQTSHQILVSGFGVGLSWASSVLTLDKIHCPPISNYEGNK